MSESSRLLTALIIAVGVIGAFGVSPGAQAAAASSELSYEVDDTSVHLSTGNMSAALCKAFPSIAVKGIEAPDEDAYGFVFSAILAYNESEDDGLVLETVPYHASLEHATWSMDTPVIEGEGGTSTAYVSMSSSVTMNKRLAAWDGNPSPSLPGIEKIVDWATVTVRYQVSTSDFSSTYGGTLSEGEYPVNGSTEMKFEVSIDINVPIDATSMALDIGVMKMDYGTFEPTAMDEQYVLRGFQSDGVVTSDPDVNETVDDTLIIHEFSHRGQLKQMFAFVEDTETAFFSWASKAMSATSDVDGELDDITTYYRTDGEALRLYLCSELMPETASVMHDPSLGLLPGAGGIVRLPDGSVLGSSAASTLLGVIIGVAVAGGVSALIIVRRSRPKDETEVVVLEKNRYYRGK